MIISNYNVIILLNGFLGRDVAFKRDVLDGNHVLFLVFVFSMYIVLFSGLPLSLAGTRMTTCGRESMAYLNREKPAYIHVILIYIQ